MADAFTKFDKGKPMVSLVQPNFILGMAEVMTVGAKKYSINNWKLGSTPEDIRRYQDAVLRHTLAYIDGEHLDPETGLSHAYHAACNLMFLEYFKQD